MKLHRISAIILHYWYHSKRSLPRVMDVFYWPTMELILWGFVSRFLEKTELNVPGIAAFLLGGVILWGVFTTSQHDVTIAFLEDVWHRNIINLFVSPLTVAEYLLGGIVVGLIKTFVIIGYISALAGVLYHFNLFTIGFSLIPFIANLFLFGIAAGIFISAIIFRYGTETQILAFSIGFLLQPISSVFYPLSALPEFLQPIASALSTTHVFEGMRGVLSGSGFSALHFWAALGLNILYLILASLFYARMFRRVRELGLISKVE